MPDAQEGKLFQKRKVSREKRNKNFPERKMEKTCPIMQIAMISFYSERSLPKLAEGREENENRSSFLPPSAVFQAAVLHPRQTRRSRRSLRLDVASVVRRELLQPLAKCAGVHECADLISDLVESFIIPIRSIAQGLNHRRGIFPAPRGVGISIHALGDFRGIHRIDFSSGHMIRVGSSSLLGRLLHPNHKSFALPRVPE